MDNSSYLPAAVGTIRRTDFQTPDEANALINRLSTLAEKSKNPDIRDAAASRLAELDQQMQYVPQGAEFMQQAQTPDTASTEAQQTNVPTDPQIQDTPAPVDAPAAPAPTNNQSKAPEVPFKLLPEDELHQRIIDNQSKVVTKSTEKLRKLNALDAANRARNADPANMRIPDRSLGLQIKDFGIAVATGIVDLVDMAASLTNIGTLGAQNALFKAGDPSGKEFAQRSEQLKNYLMSLNSYDLKRVKDKFNILAAQRKAKNFRENSNETDRFFADFSDSIKEYLFNPAVTFDAVFRSAPQLFAGGGVGTVARKAVASTVLKKALASNKFDKILAQNILKEAPGVTSKKAANDVAKFLKRTKGAKAKKDFNTQRAAKILSSKAVQNKAANIATKANIGFVGVSEGASNAISAQAEILNSTEQDMYDSSPIYTNLRNKGMSHKDAVSQIAAKVAAITAVTSGVLGAAASKVTGAGSIESKLFTGNLFTKKSKLGKALLGKFLNKGVVKPLKGITRTALTEGTEETLQGASGQFAVNLGKKASLNPKQSLLTDVADSAGAGLVVGVASAGAIHTTSTTAKAALALMGKGIRKASGAVKAVQQEKDISAAAEKGDVSKFTDTESKNYSPQNAVEALTRVLAKKENATPDDINKSLADIVPHMNNMEDNITAEMEKAQAETDPKKKGILLKEATKNIHSFIKFREAVNAMHDSTLLSEKDTKQALKSLLEDKVPAAEASNLVDRLLGSMSSKRSVSLEEATKLLKRRDLSAKQQTRIKAYIDTTTAINTAENDSTLASVHNDVIYGSDSKIGITEHLRNISIAVAANDDKLINSSVSRFNRFVARHTEKEQLVSKAYEEALGNSSGTKFINTVAQKYGLTIHKNSGDLVTALQTEAAIMSDAIKEANSILNTDKVPTTPVTPPVATPENIAKDLETKLKEDLNKSSKSNVKGYAANFIDFQKAVTENKFTAASKKGKTAYTITISKDGKPIHSFTIPIAVNSAPVVTSKHINEAKKLEKEFKQALDAVGPTDKLARDAKLETFIKAGKAAGFDILIKKGTVLHTISISKDGKLIHKFTVPKTIVEKSNVVTEIPPVEIKYTFLDTMTNNPVTFTVGSKGSTVEATSKDFFDFPKKSPKNNVLYEFTDFFTGYTNNDETVNAFVKSLDLTSVETNTLESISNFVQDLRVTMLQGPVNTQGVPTITNEKALSSIQYNPLYMLYNKTKDSEEPNKDFVNPNVLNAVALAITEWLAHRAASTLHMTKDEINSFIGVEGNLTPPASAQDLLGKVGTLENNVVNELGLSIVKMLKLQTKSEKGHTFSEKLIAQLGHVALATMIQHKLVVSNTVNNGDIQYEKDLLNWREGTIPTKSKLNAYTRFIRATTEEITVVTSENTEITFDKLSPINEDITSSSVIVSMVIGKLVETFKEKAPPSLTPNTHTSRNMGTSYSNNGEHGRAALAGQDSLPHKFTKTFHNFNKLPIMAQKQISGYDTGKVIDILEESTKSSNHQIEIDLQNMQNYINLLASTNNGVDTSFYYTHSNQSNGRVLSNPVMSIQASKVVRPFVHPVSQEIQISSKDTTSSTFTYFAINILERLGIPLPTTEGKLLRTLLTVSSTPVYKKAIAAIQKDGDTLTRKEVSAIVAGVKQGGENGESYAALAGLANFLTARKTSAMFDPVVNASFDGKTNGYANSIMQFASSMPKEQLVSELAKVGVYADNAYDSFHAYSMSPLNVDVYQGLSLAHHNEILKLDKEIAHVDVKNIPKNYKDRSPGERLVYSMRNKKNPLLAASGIINGAKGLVGEFAELNENGALIPTKAGRDAAKPVVTKVNYGAQIGGIVKGLTHVITSKLYKDIQKAYREINKEGLELIESNVNLVMGHTKGDKFYIHINMDTAKGFAFNPIELLTFNSRIKIVYGSPLKQALEDQFGTISDARITLAQNIGIGATLFVRAFKNEMEKKAKSLGLDVNDLTVKAAIEVLYSKELIKLLPILKLPATKEGVEKVAGIMGLKLKKGKFLDKDLDVSKYDANTLDSKKPTLNDASRHQTTFVGNLISGDKTLSSTGGFYYFTTANLAATINATIAAEAETANSVMMNYDVVNTYDGFGVALDKATEVNQHLQESFIDVAKTYNVYEEVVTLLRRIKLGFNEYKKNNPNMDLQDLPTEEAINASIRNLDTAKKLNTDVLNEVLGGKITVQQYVGGFTGSILGTSNQETATVPKKQNTEQIVSDTVVKEAEKTKPLKQPEQPEQLVLDLLDAVNKETEEDNIKGSSPIPIDTENFKADDTLDVNMNTASTIFNALGKMTAANEAVYGNVVESPMHVQYLGKLLLSIEKSIIEPLKLNIRSGGDTTHGVIQNRSIFIQTATEAPGNSLQMSAQVTYVHELIHGVTAASIDADGPLRAEALRLFKIADKVTTFVDFLSDPADINNPAEVAAAKDRYNYIFRNTNSAKKARKNEFTGEVIKTSKNNYLHEFIAFAATDENYRKKLEEVSPKVVERYTNNKFSNLIDSLTNFIDKMINIFRRKHIITPQANMADQVTHLVYLMAHIDNNQKTKIAASLNVGDIIDSVANKALRNFVVQPILKFLARRKGNFKSKALNSAATIAEVLPKTTFGQWADALQNVRRRQHITSSNLFNSLFTEMVGVTTKTKAWHALASKSNKLVDQLRRTVSENTTKVLLDSFGPEGVSDKESIAMTKVLFKTDIAALMGTYSYTDIHNFIMNTNNKTDKEIKKLVSQLQRFGTNSNFYINMALSLAHVMVEGKQTLADTPLNAYAISRLFGTDAKTIGNLDTAKEIIDKLTTLYALQLTTNSEKQLVNEVVSREMSINPDDNGFIFTLQNYELHKKESKSRLFNDEEAFMIKGYIKEIYDPNITFKVGTAAQEDDMLKEGYTKKHQLQKDDTDPTKGVPQYFYVNKNSATDSRVSGITNLSNNVARGHNILAIRNQLEAPDPMVAAASDFAEIRRNKAIQSKTAFSHNPVTSLSKNLYFAVFDKQGKVVNYRYIMNEYNKNTVLNKNNNFANIMGAMMGSIESKINSASINRDIVSEAHRDYKANISKEPTAFVLVGPASSDPRLREAYRLLPEDMRKEIQHVWGSKSMYLRDTVVDMVFGYKKLNVGDLANKMDKLTESHYLVLQHLGKTLARLLRLPLIRAGENVWEALVKVIKDTIVIRIFKVLRDNVISNTMILLTAGVPVKDIIKSHKVAIKASLEYQDMEFKVFKLKTHLKTKSDLNPSSPLFNKAKRDKIEAKIEQLRDSLALSPVKELNDAGVYQTIVEDVSADDDAFSYKTKFEEWADPVISKVPSGVKVVAKHIFMAHGTPVYKFMRHATQMSDFVARYTLHQHQVNNKGMNKADSIEKIITTFINYDIPTHPGIQKANDLGFVMFTKFMLRIQRVILTSAKENPGRVMALFILQALLGVNPSDIFETNLLTGPGLSRINWNPLSLVFQLDNASIVNGIDAAI